MAVTPQHIKDWLVICEILGGCGVVGPGPGPIDDIKIDGGRAWVYDITRDKWLSTDRLSAIAGRKGRAKKIYLRLVDGQSSNLTGYRLPRDATITAVSAQTRDDESWTLRIRKNGDPTDLYSLTISSTDGAHNRMVNVDLDEGDRVQFFADTTGFFGIKDPFVWVEIAWRNDNL